MEEQWPPPDYLLKTIDLSALRAGLRDPASRWSDDNLLHLAKVYLASHNAESAALIYFELVASICAYRPHLAESLLEYPLDALAALGVTSAGQALGFVRYHYDRWAWYGWLNWRTYFPSDRIGPEGRLWLTQELPQLHDTIQRVLDDSHRRTEQYLREVEDE